MDDFFGSLFGDGGAEGIADIAAGIFGAGREAPEESDVPIVYERYLCGGRPALNINDR
jgi:hypothetical protein